MRDCDAEMYPMWDGDGCPCEEFDLDRADADTDVPRLVGALRAVLELHKDDRFDRRHGRSFCAECLQDDGMPVPYPCPTVTAITIELERHL